MSTEKYSFKLGDFEIKVLSDFTREGPMDMGEMFPDVPSEELNAAMEKYNIDPENVIFSFNAIFVDTGDRRVLIDTGIGRGMGGHFLDHVDSEGIAYESIDHIVFTHGHADHIGGVTDPEGELVFPNAEYWMWGEEWEFWQEDSNMASEPPHAVESAKQNLPAVADRLTLLREEGEFIPNFSAIHAPGHTVGLIAVVVESEGEKLLIAADSFHFPFQVEHPDLRAHVDRMPERVLESRIKLLNYCVANDAKLHAYHFPHPGLGNVIHENGLFRWEGIS